MRNYDLPAKQRIIEKLRSVDEVKEEEVQRRKHWVPGRYHEYLGLHRLFALRIFPKTHDVRTCSPSLRGITAFCNHVDNILAL